MPKDSQIDPKQVRNLKALGGPSLTDERYTNKSRNTKKHSNKHDSFQSEP